MGLITSNGKIVLNEDGRALTFDTLIGQANAVTGKNDRTISAAVQTLIDGYGQGAPPVIETLSVSANGTYAPSLGVDGFAPVTVNVPTMSPLINGRAFDCGTFTLATNNTTGYTVTHNLGVVPGAAFLWAVDAPITLDGASLRYIAMRMRCHKDVPSYTAGGNVNNEQISGSSGASGGAYRITWDDETISFGSNATYPLRAGIVYQWIAIAGDGEEDDA